MSFAFRGGFPTNSGAKLMNGPASSVAGVLACSVAGPRDLSLGKLSVVQKRKQAMKKHIVTGLLALGLCALPLSGVASAQQTGGTYQTGADQPGHGTDLQGHVENQVRQVEDKGGSSWGWLGLIGLAGLAGLRGRRADESTTRQTYRTGEPLGSR
jgi:MYXO-CTERM domain-containing protein